MHLKCKNNKKFCQKLGCVPWQDLETIALIFIILLKKE